MINDKVQISKFKSNPKFKAQITPTLTNPSNSLYSADSAFAWFDT